jgi:hypothetical protein
MSAPSPAATTARLIEAKAIEIEEQKSPPLGGLLEFHSLHVLAFIVDLVGLLPLSFSPGSFTRAEGFLVTLAINKDGP